MKLVNNVLNNSCRAYKTIIVRGMLWCLVFSIFSSCIIIKEKDEIIKKEVESEYQPAVKSKIKMSDQLIRTEHGDVVVSVPEGWFFVEPDNRISSDIFAVVVNPEYTLSAVFSYIKETPELNKTFEQEGYLGLARISFDKHATKNSNNIVLVDNYKNYELNNQSFGIYNFTKLKDNMFGQAVVFVSSQKKYYEFSLVSMNFASSYLPNRTEFEEIFYSILSTLKF